MKQGKPGINNPMQKGKRRQKLHDNQNNVGDPKQKSYYTTFDGKEIE
ncbi:clostri-philic family protein [Clostridium sp. HCP1S3_B4]|nr:clostri-philic family protein [Clostridiales bacterium]NLK23533.1 hypothetical protein [Clostridiales bacterium]